MSDDPKTWGLAGWTPERSRAATVDTLEARVRKTALELAELARRLPGAKPDARQFGSAAERSRFARLGRDPAGPTLYGPTQTVTL